MIVEALGRSWEWPDADTKGRAVVFDELVSLPAVYKRLKGSRTAIQAGGNMGVFPWKLAQKFDRVVTAEPDPICFPYLDRNVQVGNVTKLNVAFADMASKVSMRYLNLDNLGSQHIAHDGGPVDAITIDSLAILDCDLIYLDIEGAEMLALRGAAATIAMSRPVIAVEDKGLSDKFGTPRGAIAKWLALNFGYEQVGTAKRDVIFACE